MGIRKRILLGFVSLAFLLFIAGLISYFELGRLNENTMLTVDKGAAGITKAKEILDLIERQDILILEKIDDDSVDYGRENIQILSNIDMYVTQLSENYPQNSDIHQVTKRKSEYESVVKSVSTLSTHDFLVNWYFKQYKPAYRNLAHVTKDFMVQTQNDVAAKTKEIKSHAYRATMQGIAAIIAAIIIIIIFFYMIDTYFVKPIIHTSKSLHRYLTHKTPFEVKAEGREEVYILQTYIKQLITNIKNSNKSQL